MNCPRMPYRPELVSAAQAAGFLHLQGSDLVFNHGCQQQSDHCNGCCSSSAVYYDFILSCRRRPVSGGRQRQEAISYLARLDDRTNIVEIQQYRIQADKLNDLDRLLSPSDLTLAALSFHIWQSDLRGKKVLLLLPDEGFVQEQQRSCSVDTPGVDRVTKQDAMNYVVKMAEKYRIVYHIQIVQSKNGSSRRNSNELGLQNHGDQQSASSLPKRLAIMLRLMMCQGQPVSVDISKNSIRQFSFFVEPRKWFLLWCY